MREGGARPHRNSGERTPEVEEVSRAERLFGMAQFLHTQAGRTLDELVQRFDVSERTIFRDLASLDEQGVPIEHLDGGRYRVLGQRQRTPLLDSTDWALVRAALPAATRQQDGPLASRLAKLIDKVESALRGRPDGAPANGTTGDQTSSIERLRDDLERLVRQRRPARILYRSLSGDGEAFRGVDPWELFELAHAWYLIGRCHLYDEPRLFRLERIRSVRADAGRFEVPPDFDLQNFLNEAWRIYLGSPGGSKPNRRKPRR